MLALKCRWRHGSRWSANVYVTQGFGSLVQKAQRWLNVIWWHNRLAVDINLPRPGSSSNLICFGIWRCKNPLGQALMDGCPLLHGGSLNVESLAASAANSRAWSVSLPEGSMNQINHGAKEAENLQYKWTRAVAHSIYGILTFGIRKINQTAQTIVTSWLWGKDNKRSQGSWGFTKW